MENILIELGWIKIIAIPLIASFIGWMTNWVAIKMLFHPKKPIKILFFTIQGIFYRKQKKLAANLGKTIEEKLFSHNDIQKVLDSDHFHEGIHKVFGDYIEDFFQNRLSSLHPMLALVPEDIISVIKEKLVKELEKLVPNLIQFAQQGLEKNLQVRELIQKKIEAFDVSQLEHIIFSIMKAEFKHIEYLGGVIGFFIGISQLIILSLA